LEKFEMKKTLVAIAAAAAVTGAMADVTITGFIDQAVQTTGTTLAAGTKTTVNTIGNNLNGQDQLSFNASEDLGDGMSAYGTYNIQPTISANGNTGNLTDAGSGIGIKGAFGNVFLGNNYDQVRSTMGDADVTGFGATASVGSVWAPTNALSPSRQQLIRWTLPSLTQGLDIVVEHNNGGLSTGVADSNGVGISFTTGGLYVKYALNQTKTSSGATTFSTYDGANVATTSFFDGSTANYQAVALTYDLGAAKLYYGNQQMTMSDAGDAAEAKWTAGVSVPFGAASLGYGHSSAQFTSIAGLALNGITSDAILAKYNFSKRTLAYLKTAKTTTSSTSASITNTSLGLVHSF